jgi:mycoredoxin
LPESIVVYTTSWCPDCIRSKRVLRRLGVEFEEINIDEVPGSEQRMKDLNGGSDRVPTLVIGETVLIEPSEDSLIAALKLSHPQNE